jgi:DNA (cytosine-5)-methyltransferase 1
MALGWARLQNIDLMKKLIAIDLFCGCGGLTRGLRDAGFRVLGAVDNDSYALEAYRANHAGVRLWSSDIRRISAARVRKDLKLQKGQLDLLAGCPPCQGFSSVRTLNGSRHVEDHRNDLLFDFLRFVRAFRPRAVMLENVPGLAADPRFDRFVTKLCSLKYRVEHRIVNAADHGVPQRRKRLIVLARAGNGKVEFPAPKSGVVTVRDAIGGLPPAGKSGDPLHDAPEKRSEKVAELIALVPKDGGSRSDLPERLRLKCHQNLEGFYDVYGRMAWGDVAPTITSGCSNPSKGRFLHPIHNRAITLREAAVLQGFPVDYKFPKEIKKERVALMIGNALPPPLIAAHASLVRSKLDGSR